MPAVYTVGQLLPNGATVVSDDFTTDLDGSTHEVMVDSAGNTTATFTPAPGTAAANQSTVMQRAQAALSANATDQTQDQNIIAQSATVPAGTLTAAQLSTLVRQLAQAVATLAQNDINSKKELNALIRLALSQFDSAN